MLHDIAYAPRKYEKTGRRVIHAFTGIPSLNIERAKAGATSLAAPAGTSARIHT